MPNFGVIGGGLSGAKRPASGQVGAVLCVG